MGKLRNFEKNNLPIFDGGDRVNFMKKGKLFFTFCYKHDQLFQ
jgi:hypothetical protein